MLLDVVTRETQAPLRLASLFGLESPADIGDLSALASGRVALPATRAVDNSHYIARNVTTSTSRHAGCVASSGVTGVTPCRQRWSSIKVMSSGSVRVK